MSDKNTFDSNWADDDFTSDAWLKRFESLAPEKSVGLQEWGSLPRSERNVESLLTAMGTEPEAAAKIAPVIRKKAAAGEILTPEEAERLLKTAKRATEI